MRRVTLAAGWSSYADFFLDAEYEKVRFFTAGDYWTTPVEADGRVTVNDTLPSIISLTAITFRVE